MEPVQNVADVARKKPSKQGRVKKLDAESAKLLSQLKEKANKKPFGRKVKESEILAIALTLVGAKHMEELQEKTLSESDRLKMAHDEFQKKNGRITMDQFIGRLLRNASSAT